jgi:GTP-binding protein YchF
MKTALLGLPQAGKRTFFELLTGRHAPESRKPEECVDGVAPIRDPRIDVLNGICKPERKVYAENIFTLCPDVVEGAGARVWLDAARKCDLLCLVVRGFQSDAVYHPAGSVDAKRDLNLILGELMLADMEVAEKRLVRIDKEKRAGQSAEQANEEKTLRRCMEALEAGTRLEDVHLSAAETVAVRNLSLVTLIPVLAAYNVDEDEVTKSFGPRTVTVSAKIEQEINAIQDPAERKDYLSSLGLEASGVDRMNAAAYDALGLMSFYTIGKDEVRAWPVRKGSAAPTAAGKVHSDIERGFIRAEVIKYDDLVATGSEHAAKTQGKVQSKGKDYIMQDGDICHFLFNV